ncbi:hypothetical protein ACH4UM_19900 [Streptomyces sp. NPDC020801]
MAYGFFPVAQLTSFAAPSWSVRAVPLVPDGVEVARWVGRRLQVPPAPLP